MFLCCCSSASQETKVIIITQPPVIIRETVLVTSRPVIQYPTNTSSPTNSTSQFGSYNNPVPIGSSYRFPGFGALTVENSQWNPGQTGLAVALLSYACERPKEQTCSASDFIMRVSSSSGATYEKAYDIHIPSPFFSMLTPDFHGGATLTGYEGFLITQNEGSLLMDVSLISGAESQHVYFRLSDSSISIQATNLVTELTATPLNTYGSYDNPLPIGISYRFPGYGNLIVLDSSWKPHQTRYAIVHISFTCERPKEQICDTSDFMLDANGGSGQGYERGFDISIPEPVFGSYRNSELHGGVTEIGYAGFLITSDESQLLMKAKIMYDFNTVYFQITP